MIPAWLANTLGDTRRSARLRLCPRCGAPVLAGLDGSPAGLPVRADPTALTETGEAVALLQKRATFDLSSLGGRKEINYRSAEHIKGPRRYPVLAEHRCGQPLAQFSQPTPERKRYVIPDSPPF